MRFHFFVVINISVTVSASTAIVCVETEGAATDLGMPQNSASYQKISPGRSNFILVRPT